MWNGAHYLLPVTRSCPSLIFNMALQAAWINWLQNRTYGSPSLGKIPLCRTIAPQTHYLRWNLVHARNSLEGGNWHQRTRCCLAGAWGEVGGSCCSLSPSSSQVVCMQELRVFLGLTDMVSPFPLCYLHITHYFLDDKDKSPTRSLVWQSSKADTFGGEERRFLVNASKLPILDTSKMEFIE